MCFYVGDAEIKSRERASVSQEQQNELRAESDIKIESVDFSALAKCAIARVCRRHAIERASSLTGRQVPPSPSLSSSSSSLANKSERNLKFERKSLALMFSLEFS